MTERVVEPAVWLNLTQQELDDAYNQIKYAPNRNQIVTRFATNSARVRARIGEPKHFAYGPSAIEVLDVYPTKALNAPISIFIHGGAWRNGTAKDSAQASELFVRAGAHSIVIDFIDVEAAGGSLTPMAEQVRRAVAWVYNNATSFGGDRERIYICGHSSGGHLGGVVLVTDWTKDFGLPRDVVKGGLLCSGMYDLKPVRLSARSSYVMFTDEMEHALSTQRHIDGVNCPIILAYGSLETPEFQRQSREFAAALSAAGKPVSLLVGAGYNHFEIIETLANPYGLLGSAVIDQMDLRTDHGQKS
jgi:arylformamidase